MTNVISIKNSAHMVKHPFSVVNDPQVTYWPPPPTLFLRATTPVQQPQGWADHSSATLAWPGFVVWSD